MNAAIPFLMTALLALSCATGWAQGSENLGLNDSQAQSFDDFKRRQSTAFQEMKAHFVPGEIPDKNAAKESVAKFWGLFSEIDNSNLPQSSKDVFLQTMVGNYSKMMTDYIGVLSDIMPDRPGQTGFQSVVNWVGRFGMSIARDLLDFRAVNLPFVRGRFPSIDKTAAMSFQAFEEVMDGQIEYKLRDGYQTGEFAHLERLIERLEKMEPIRFKNRHRFMKVAYVGLAVSHLLGFGWLVVGVPDIVGFTEIVLGLGDSPSYLAPLYSNAIWASFFTVLWRMRHNNSGARVRKSYERLKAMIHRAVAHEDGQPWPTKTLPDKPELGSIPRVCKTAIDD
ncbi:MAG: hypothetical protein AAF202_05255 [Pseudomonadota bacterium]